VDKYKGTTILENVLALAMRAERVIESNCVLLSGLPLDHPDWPISKINEWVWHAAHQLRATLGITVDRDQLHDYLNAYASNGTIYQDGGSCSFPIPILLQQFQLGGGQNPSNLPPAFGINPGGQSELFFFYQAIPTTSTTTIRDVRASVELCTFRGIPGNEHEAQAVLALLQSRVEDYIAPICQLPPSAFDLVLHCRMNLSAHHANNKPSYEFIVTLYCRPNGKHIGSLRDKLFLQNAPSEANLDWIGEIWGSYYAARTTPPSMLLLHRTPHFCIYGFPPTTTTVDIVKALIADNPDLAISLLAYIWIGPYREDGPKSINFIFRGKTPSIIIGVFLSAIGATRSDGDPHDNPSMLPIRENTAGDLVHHQLIASSSITRKGWTPGQKEKWAKLVDGILSKMPTLQEGHSLGITHSGTTTWAEPTYFPPAPIIRPIGAVTSTSTPVDELSQLREKIRQQEAQISLQNTQLSFQANHIRSLETKCGDEGSARATSVGGSLDDTLKCALGPHGTVADHHLQTLISSLISDHLADFLKDSTSNKRSATQISDNAIRSFTTGDHPTEEDDSHLMDTK
jgi:hypothetical protein